MKYKNSISILFFTLFAVFLYGEDLSVSISPNPILLNEPAQYSIETTNSGQIQQIKLPEIDGIIWNPSQRQSRTNIINGDYSSTTSLGFKVTRKGTFSIPSISVTTSKGEYKTLPISFTVEKRDFGLRDSNGNPVEISTIVFSKLSIDSSRKEFYINEILPIKLQIISHNQFPIQLTQMPEIKYPEDSFLPILKNPNEQNQIQRLSGKTDKFNCNILEIDQEIRATKAGIWTISSIPDVAYREASRDSFFFDNGRLIPIPMEEQKLQIKILPLPKAPEKKINLSLITDKTPTYTLSSKNVKLGDSLNLKLQIPGNNTGIKLPELELPGFRFYTPELSYSKDNDTTTLNYVFVPLSDGEKKIHFEFVYFNVSKKSYINWTIDESIVVRENKELAKETTSSSPLAPKKQISEEENDAGTTDILFLKKINDKNETPASQKSDTFFNYIILFIIGLIALATNEILLLKKRMNPRQKRIAKAKAQRSNLIKKIQNSNDEELSSIIRTDISDYICDIKNIEQGASLSELKNHIKNDSLIEILEDAEESTYRPHTKITDSSKIKMRLINILKKSSFLIVFSLLLLNFSPDINANEKTDNSIAIQFNKAENLYLKGQFAAATQIYKNLSTSYPYSKEIWFNLGNCAYQEKKFTWAILYFEKARRLDISDSGILENLNASCLQLNLPERNKVKNPIDFLASLNQSFSEKTWGNFAGISFLFICGIIILIRRKKRSFFIYSLLILSIFICGLCFGNKIYQKSTFFNEDKAIVVQADTTIWNLPLEKSAKKIGQLNGGEMISQKEVRGDWVLIRFNKTEGWVKKETLKKILPIETI